MNLQHKVLLSISLIWIGFLLVISIILYPLLTLISFTLLISLGILFYGVTYVALKVLIFNRLNKLKHIIEQQKFSDNFPINNNNDDLTILTIKTNYLIEILHTYEEKLNHTSFEENKKNSIPSIYQPETKIEDHLSQLAHYDSLTALPNYVFFNEILNKTLGNASRHNKILAILLINLNLQNIHNTKKHKTANKILKEMANRTSTILRSGDILARSGAHEFIILLNDIKHTKFAGYIAEKILQTYSTPILIDGDTFSILTSIGISIFPEDGLSLENLHKKADLALYKAKITNNNIYQYYSNDMTLEANKYIQLDAALRKAITNNEFILHYQPQLNIATGKINCVEALIRWLNPEIGIVSPNDFIHYIEDNGLIITIGEWVIREACRANKSWQELGYPPIRVAVNLSPSQFLQKNIVDVVERALTDSGLESRYLELEITEMTIMSNVPETIQKLNQFKQLGVKICIDDFGTGYTSISYLKHFIIDVLKIDQSFIKSIPHNHNDIAIVTAIIALGHNLGMRVVAEGVETVEQLEFLTQHECDLVQGYYLNRPLPEEELLLQFKKI